MDFLSMVVVRPLIGKEWNSVSWDGDVWEDSAEAGGIDPLNYDESSLPVEEISPPPVELASSPPAKVAFLTPG